MDRETLYAISGWCIVSWDTARVFQAYPMILAKYFLAQEWSSGTPQIHSPVKVDGLRFDTACIF